MAAETQMDISAGRRAGAALLAILNLAGAAIVAFLELIAGALSCDDNCSPAPGWRNDPSAWQWQAIVVVGLVIFVSALVLTVAVLMRRAEELRRLAALTQLVAVVVLAILSWTATDTHGAWTYPMWILLFFGATGLGSVMSARRY